MLSLFDLYVSMCDPFEGLLIWIDDIKTLYNFSEFISDFSVNDLYKLKLVFVNELCVNGYAIQCTANYDQLLELFFITPEALGIAEHEQSE